MLSLTDFLLVTLIQAAGCALQGALGYGGVLLTGPLFIWISTGLLPGPALFGSVFLSVLVALREKQALDLWGLKWVLAGRIPTAFVCAYAVAQMSQETMIVVFGLLILLAVGMSLVGFRFPARRGVMLVAGVISGIMGTIAAMGGPPVALIYQDAPGPRLRSTLSGYFIVGASFSLIALIPAGKFGLSELWLCLALIPGTLLGFFASRQLVPWLDRGYTRPAVLTLAASSALVAILRQLF